MKFIAQVVLVLLISLLLQLFLPWWTMAIGAFAIALLFRRSGFTSFLAGLLGAGLLWYLAAYMTTVGSSALAERIAAILPTKSVSMLLLVTAVIGGLVGGFASMTGGLIVYKKKPKY